MDTLPNKVNYAAYYRNAVDDGSLVEIGPGLSFAREMDSIFDGGEGGIWLPWDKRFRVRKSEVTVFAGVNGHGKSLLMGQLLTYLCKANQVCCNLSMEMPPARTLARQCKQAVGNGSPTKLYRDRYLYWTRDKYFLSDFSRPMKPQDVLGAILWANRERGCTQIVVDSLMKCGIGEDDYNGQKAFMSELCELAKALEIHIWLIAHSRKREDENKPMNKFDVKGTGAITDLADNALTVFRNKRKERAVQNGADEVNGTPVEDLNDAVLIVDKQRHGEWEGHIGLDFLKDSTQYVKHGQREPMDLLRTVLDNEPAVWEEGQ